MPTYYKSTLTVQGAQDTNYRELCVERKDLASVSESFEAFSSSSGALAANMETALTIPLGKLGSVNTIYLEYMGTTIRLGLADNGNTTRYYDLNSGSATTRKRMLIEGTDIGAVTIQNIHADTAGSYFVALFGPEQAPGGGE